MTTGPEDNVTMSTLRVGINLVSVSVTWLCVCLPAVVCPRECANWVSSWWIRVSWKLERNCST